MCACVPTCVHVYMCVHGSGSAGLVVWWRLCVLVDVGVGAGVVGFNGGAVSGVGSGVGGAVLLRRESIDGAHQGMSAYLSR